MQPSEKLEQSIPNRHLSKNKLMEVGAIVSASLALGASTGKGDRSPEFSPAASASPVPAMLEKAKKPPKKISKTSGIKLPRADQLPGKNITVPPEIREMLQQATVKLLARKKDSDEQYRPWCTGDVVSYSKTTQNEDGTVSAEQAAAVETAAHCIDEAIGLSGSSKINNAPAINYINVSTHEFAIADPMDESYPEHFNPIAHVTGISVSHKSDLALLEVSVPEGKGGGLRGFTNIKPLELNFSKNRPIVGMEVAISSNPNASNNESIYDTGRFVGYLDDEIAGRKMRFAAVTLEAALAEEDGCEFGASGSVAAGKNFITGPLAGRIWRTYDAEIAIWNNKKLQKGEAGYQEAYDQFLKDTVYWRKYYEQRLGVKLLPNQTLCLFSDVNESMMKDVVDGLDNYIWK